MIGLKTRQKKVKKNKQKQKKVKTFTVISFQQLSRMSTKKKNKQHTPTEITIDQLKDLMKELRAFNLQWMAELLNQIRADTSVDEADRNEINERKIYNVFFGIVVNGKWKLLIFTQGKALLKHYQDQVPA
jgi:hypothetical protein